MPSFIELLQRKLTRITDPDGQAMVATGLIGALTALFTAYLNGRLTATREQFIDYCVDMLLSRVSSLLTPTPGVRPPRALFGLRGCRLLGLGLELAARHACRRSARRRRRRDAAGCS